MQMLAAGGMPVLMDTGRKPDTDNPRGYFEWEPIQRLPQDPECVARAEGKAVKVISQLLLALPGNHDYRVIFLERPLLEVIASQAEMIRRRGTTGAALGSEALIGALQAHLNQVSAWLKGQPNMIVSRLHYHRVLSEPRQAAVQLARFLERTLDTEAMAQQVDPALYRQ